MRVFYDAYELQPRSGKSLGIYSYAVQLWRALMADPLPGLEYVVACNVANADDFVVPIGAPGVRRIVGDRPPGRLARQWWLRFAALRLARAECCTAYLSPKGFLPGQFGRVRHLRSAVVVHDLIPLWYARNFPQQFGKLEQYVVNGGLRRTLRHADDVIAISAATAQEIAFHCGRTADVHVVHNGLTLHAAGQAPLAGDFILAISSPLPHKNLQGVLTAYRAYRTLTTAPLPLLLTGVTDPHEPGVVASGWLSDPDLHACFSRARALLFLPLIEGFGFPPLEAMAAGTPVVCSDIPALRETTQGQAALVHPGASLEIARALLQATTETPQRRAWVEAGPRVAREYLWSRCAQGVQQVLAGLLMREHQPAGHAEPLSRPGSEP